MHQRILVSGALVTFALAVACSEKSPSPTSPTGTGTSNSTTAALADGSTLKVSAPNPVSPANGSTLSAFGPVLTVTSSQGRFVPAGTLQYRFQLLDTGNAVLRDELVSGTTFQVTSLDTNREYRWRCRAENGNGFGPWSATWSFRTPDRPTGYIRGNEVFDPLTEGVSVGQIVGPVTFIPGEGVRLDSFGSYITYPLDVPLTDGEYSFLATGVDENLPGSKTKIMSMWNGNYDDPQPGCGLTCNSYRMTVEIRGNGYGEGGVVAWRFIPGDATGSDNREITTTGSERVRLNFSRAGTYFFRATWNGAFNLSIRQDGASGREIYSFGKGYSGVYDPRPHYVVIGAPPSRSGELDQSRTEIVIRNVWVSSRPRPDYANH